MYLLSLMIAQFYPLTTYNPKLIKNFTGLCQSNKDEDN
jgi:hypothetical protein